ncbi:YcnI family protein [Paenibacillus sp. JX-17]|uniref:YcnI family protein n=1 Tax=Paenibacillus lacisoli TaxID=3064525 RepID=A0ABT9CC04_9BACL|nr:YcnI family protein [Paenibacillus sp. JX-17]MDO7906801.1 YcnI family protein [Paenibacillus sp. JX-17]
MKIKGAKKLISVMAAAAASMMLFTGIASAHVSVKPAVSQTEAWETYSMKVPVEKNLPTTKIVLKVPEQVMFKQYQPIPGWSVDLEKNSMDVITQVTWTAAGDGIQPGQYQLFSFVAQNPAADAEVAWNAYQYYSDGSIVEWTGDEGADHPHSITKISAAPAETAAPADSGHHSAGAADSTGTSSESKDNANSAPADDSGNTTRTVTLIIAVAALVLSVITLVVTLGKRRSR